ncbi:bile acid:sodium symporter family protein [Alphaproteobacteria bacterium GH1-50]|uniref:Bile acid:sodium symporter family protein n=1 Tax=Kangsaoukella pontilimi TaxID=2691042 RepID=A0A7C9MRI9_9RHOB|nr:bile acid:sodium symporter [Kangsaoukella pontilimi]MXQ08357.1 bile acid:sodium symporter family protein [Kangsaoukella pontilimi]
MDVFVGALLPLAVVVIMFSLGLGLTGSDFRRIARRPRAFFIGALNQVVLLPVVGYVIILLFGFTAETAVGIMILAACPGGAASNIITKLAGWDVALSVTLTASFSLTCVLTIPFVLDFAVGAFMGEAAPDIDILSTALTAFLLTALPISLGMICSAAAPSATTALAPGLGRVAVLLFAGVIAGAIFSNWQVVTENFARLGLGLFALVAALSVIGFGLSRLLKASDREAKTIAIETGVQNGALALAIAGLLVVNGPTFNAYAIPAALYSVVWLGTALPAFLLLARSSPAKIRRQP